MDLTDGTTIAVIVGAFVALLVAGSAVAFAIWYTSDDQQEIWI